MNELSIIQKTYDLIIWYVPIINRLPKTHKYQIGDRLVNNLYNFLELLIIAKYASEKLNILESLNPKLDIVRYQTRILLDFQIINNKRYEYISQLITEIGKELGSWIKQQKLKNS
ncbi:MAG: diversity-generating retroelement protein Avd [Trichodesmium sp. MAG_R01]|nr:diversity-generating retroelement protein Avd [Trichodesmium sp. MAG_R01]